MKLVCLSDTHGMHRQLDEVPAGDVLIHAGDALGTGTLEELEDLDAWLGSLPHRHKVLIAGNHDRCLEEQPEAARQCIRNVCYLQDSGVTIDGIDFWGTPWTPFYRNWSFNLKRGRPLAERWALIPRDTDVLITHGPPWGVLDEAMTPSRARRVGCRDLKAAVASLRLQAHIFGHIHESYGKWTLDGAVFVNASTCDERYRPVNPPIVVQLGE